MINKIVVSRIDSAMKKSFLEGYQINHVISLLDPNYVEGMYQNYKYNFNFLDNWDYFIFLDVQHRTNYKDYPGPQKFHVEKLLEIYKELINKPEKINLLLHCTAGISRSTAACYILLYLIHKDKQVALDKLLEIRSISNPNLLLLEYADEILGTDLSQFVHDWYIKNRRGNILIPNLEQNY